MVKEIRNSRKGIFSMKGREGRRNVRNIYFSMIIPELNWRFLEKVSQ